jgi:HK97 gp10 family phage protein
MKSFDSPLKFAEFLAASITKEHVALQSGLKACAKVIERTAKSEFGVYQKSVEHFPAWEELADSTKEDRVRQGFSENEPLLRTGKLRDSISHEVSGLEAVIGSDSDVMVYQEFGTEKIPPRPVLGPAAFRNKQKIQKILGNAAITGMMGGERIDASLGYDADVSDEGEG